MSIRNDIEPKDGRNVTVTVINGLYVPKSSG